jgi:hypothetical protein
MYDVTLLLHSLIRWLVLLTGLAAAGRGIAGWSGRRWSAADDRIGKLFVGSLDIQLLLGLILYVVLSPTVSTAFRNIGGAMRDPVLRFFLVEHAAGMIIAIVLGHIGRVRTKKATSDAAKQRAAAVFYGLAIIVILLSIPWPFMPAARPLFPWQH